MKQPIDSMRQPHDFVTCLAPRSQNHSARTMLEMLERGELDEFLCEFIGGVADQANLQTGHDRPIGETTANRMRSHLLAFAYHMYQFGREGRFEGQSLEKNPRPEYALDFGVAAQTE